VTDPVEQYRRLLEAAPVGIGGSVEILLGQLPEQTARHLRLAAIPHQFNADLLCVIDPGLAPTEANNLCETFAPLSFVAAVNGALVFHDEVRRYLFQEWLAAEPPSFREVSRRLTEHFALQEETLTGEAQVVARQQRTFHLIGADQVAGFDLFERLCRRERYGFRLNSCETLIKLVHEYDRILTPERKKWLTYHEAKLQIDLRQYSEAERLLRMLVDRGDLVPELRTRILFRLGTVKADTREWDEAAVFFRQGLDFVANHRGVEGQGMKMMLGLATVYRETDRAKEAGSLLRTTIAMAEAADDRSALAASYNSLGNLHRKLNQSRRAIEAFHNSLRHLEQAKEPFRPAQVYNNIGLVHADLAEWEPARDALEKSLEISRKAGDTHGQATALSNLARVYFNQEEHRKAVEAAGEAADLFLEIRDWYRAATTVRGLGRYYRRTGMTANARAQLQRAAHLFHRAGAEREVEEANAEIERLDKKRGLPWYAWVSLVLFALLVLVTIYAIAS